MSGWLHTLSPGVYERNALVRCEQTTLAVRVIAIVPTAEKAETLRRKKEHEARAKGRKLSEQARFLAGFIPAFDHPAASSVANLAGHRALRLSLAH